MKIIFAFTVFLFVSAPAAAIDNFHQVVDGIYRGGRPSRADLEHLKAQGIQTVINIEDNKFAVESEQKYAEQIGLRYYNIPLSVWSTPGDAAIDTILTLLQAAEFHPVFLHCKHGRDRTGLVFGLYRVEVGGWQPDDAYDEMLDLGFRPRFYKLANYFKKRTGYDP